MLGAFVRAVWTICKKDLRVWLRQPANVAITVLPALALLFIDALSAGAVGRSPVALVTLDQGARGQQMAQVIHQADLFRVSDATPTQAQALFKNLDVVAIVTIPANFTQAVEAHKPVHIEVQINNLNTDFTNDIRRAVPAAITQFYQQQGARALSGIGFLYSQATVRARAFARRFCARLRWRSRSWEGRGSFLGAVMV